MGWGFLHVGLETLYLTQHFEDRAQYQAYDSTEESKADRRYCPLLAVWSWGLVTSPSG